MKDFKENTRSKGDFRIMAKIFVYLKPHIKKLVIALLLMVVVIAIDFVPPFLIGMILDIIKDTDVFLSEKVAFIAGVSVLFVFILIVSSVCGYFQTMYLQRIGQSVVLELRQNVFEHIEKLSIGQINDVPVGKLVTRVTNDTNAIGEMYTSVVVSLIKNVIYLLGIVIALFIINAKMAIIVMITIPIAVLGTVIFRAISRKSYRTLRNNVSETNAFLAENLSGMKITQMFNQEEKKRKEFDLRNRRIRKSFFKQITTFAIYRPFIYLVSILGMLLTLYFGTIEIMNGVASAGLIVTFYSFVLKFFRPIEELSDQFNVMQDAFSSAEKIFDVLDTEPSIVDLPDAIELDSFSGQIEFKNVWFSYIENEWVLKDISFSVASGDTVAFVGATGSGKTTILSLIVRNYEIQKGEILIDGIDIRKIKRSSLRKHIGQMMQDVFLFSGTIIDNITLREDSITREEVISASKYVGVDKFIEELPNRYDNVVLERGNNFSTGQRQLLSFARTIAYKPSLMILDEATANIDSESEELIQESLNKMMNISTMLIVAHRLSTIQHSNKIIVMQKGEIKEIGSHQELLKIKGIYYSLYELQYDKNNQV